MAADDSIRQKIIIGLADVQAGDEIGNVVRHTTGVTNALTIGSTTLRLGVTGGTVGFLGHTAGATRQVVPVAAGATTAIQALQSLGLFSQS
jgi:hypothetical protein